MVPQQDLIIVEVTALGTFTEEQKKELIDLFKRGTILWVAQFAPNGMSQCIAASYSDSGTTRTYTFVFGGATLQSVTATETISA